MTAYAVPFARRPGSLSGALLFAAALLTLLAGSLVSALTQSASARATLVVVTWPSGQQVIYSEHAGKHPEAADIHKCLENKGPFQTWTNSIDWFFLCQLADGRWGTLIADKEGDTFFENTAYVKGDGLWNRVTAWLRDYCRATRYRGNP